MEFNPCAVIPVYRHENTVAPIVEKLAALPLPVILVDDGNTSEARKVLEEIAVEFPHVRLVSKFPNGGKGKAVCAGLCKALDQGYSHAFQIDADGQHDLKEIPKFLEAAARFPEAFVGGFPQYDFSVPQSRLAGRKITNFWVAVETLSRKIPDAMCGFRVYPLSETVPVLKDLHSFRMGFDIEILVRLSWRGVQMRFFPVRVFYPESGVSNFRLFHDNVEISLLHARLVCGMLFRAPRIFLNRIRHG